MPLYTIYNVKNLHGPVGVLWVVPQSSANVKVKPRKDMRVFNVVLLACPLQRGVMIDRTPQAVAAEAVAGPTHRYDIEHGNNGIFENVSGCRRYGAQLERYWLRGPISSNDTRKAIAIKGTNILGFPLDNTHAFLGCRARAPIATPLKVLDEH